MREKTDIKAVRKVAIDFLNIEPTQVDGIGESFLVNHPILVSRFVYLTEIEGMFDVLEDKGNYRIWRREMQELIENCDSEYRISDLIRRNYRLAFFSYMHEYLSDKAFALLLRESWTRAERITGDLNVSSEEMVKWFRNADKRYLMNDDEKKFLVELPNGVPIFRGVGSPDYKYGMSWTLDEEKAKWFATRFDSDMQVVYSTTIQKLDILAYFTERGENEIVVDPDTLKKCDIKIVDIT